MSKIKEVIAKVRETYGNTEKEFVQAVEEVLTSLEPVEKKHEEFTRWNIYERIVEPDRVITFKVTWQDDRGQIHVNRGYRVEFNGAIGPYKGGLRFRKSVNLGIIKFLGFEQIFKNALTGLPMGGGKGGSDFDPHGKSDEEVMRFCYAFMSELFRHIGPYTDVPAGDIGVGSREVGYLYGAYKKLKNEHTGAITGKDYEYGGSLMRPEATGYGLLYFTAHMLNDLGPKVGINVEDPDRPLKGLIVAVSGAGNVALHAIEKANEMGGKVVFASDASGAIYDEAGISGEKFRFLKELKEIRRGRIKEYAEKFNVPYFEGKSVWDVIAEKGIKVQVALPSATQNEITGRHAEALVKVGVKVVAEGANMPSTPEAIKIYKDAGILYGPAKAANAGGVAVSGLEMSQNAQLLQWTREEVDNRLRAIMRHIYEESKNAAEAYGHPGDLMMGANIAGFLKVAKAMVALGLFY
ncbi:MAG: NADP-specific glutamate dehydrogenase [Thermotogae bacterium]|nr:NADP-specific glutamate dehydrogenase [Thermotogota bacterium]